VYYLGLIEKNLKMDLIVFITDRCSKIGSDSKKFKIINQTNLSVIDKNVMIYYDPYHIFKSFMKFIIKGETKIKKEILVNFF
jgi:hypothetical protein